jgi:hypothetical protein
MGRERRTQIKCRVGSRTDTAAVCMSAGSTSGVSESSARYVASSASLYRLVGRATLNNTIILQSPEARRVEMTDGGDSAKRGEEKRREGRKVWGTAARMGNRVRVRGLEQPAWDGEVERSVLGSRKSSLSELYGRRSALRRQER